MLKIHNSLTRRKEPFQPITSGEIRMYVCGMTVYDYCHLGHARVMVVFDTIARYLRWRDFRVTYVRNITDIDDKIIQRANELAIPFQALTARFIRAMHEDESALGCLSPDLEPRATRSLDAIIDMIQALLDKGYAYVGANGDVYYAVGKFAAYGKLSGKQIEELRAGARVEVAEAKRDPLDFVLWKKAKPEEPAWDSPWGPGRPGWHIECSAMSTTCLGSHFDIHGGGADLQFPHHENEIAQSEGATGEHFVNYWLHTGFVRVDREKMSKSLGNFFTIREVLKQYSGEVIRFFILSSHYRSPLDYSEDSLQQARAGLIRLYTSLRGLPEAEAEGEDCEEYRRRFSEAMDDDFNTAGALAVLFDLAKEINRLKTSEYSKASRLAATCKQLGGVLGILQQEAETFLKGGETPTELADAEIDALIEQRNQARKTKDWATADQIRDQLKEQGIVLEDTPGGTIWRRA
ncbi:cysteine--tRNA ligase [Methylohalobius crimeensis]|uniref:cysteine--tRNA ligase n=1 Tax=Methylohalobius crimeensis TaxID=244365 RepID=UPI0003B4D579|nr:cysteine--tRNA ligase [Methylohalobius crimeensis]